MKKNKIIIGLIGILLVLLGIGCFAIPKVLKRNVSQTKVEEWNYSVIWRGVSYIGNYSGKMKDGFPSGKGSFQGVAYIDETEYDTLTYTGKWKDGKFDGKGELRQNLIDITYKGNFQEGTLNGMIRLYGSEDSSYSRVSYSQDIPRGVGFLYDTEDNILDYDYYFMGMSVKSICKTAEEIPYKNLLYDSETYYNKRIKLSCKVQDLYQENGYWYVKVTDKDENVYILRYSFEYKDDATSYMPELETGQQIEVYGFCSDLKQYRSEINKLPSIDALCISGFENQIFKNKKLKKSYSNFVNYPNFFKNSKVVLNGKYSGVYSITENNIYFFIESEDYSQDGKKMYIGYVKNNDDNIAALPAGEESIRVRGKLKLTRSVDMSEEAGVSTLLQNFPCLEVTEVITK